MEQVKSTGNSTTESGKEGIAFSRLNIFVLLAGTLLILIGFILMSGGASGDPSQFNEEVFSSTRITVAPIVILAGFAINIVAIMLKPKKG